MALGCIVLQVYFDHFQESAVGGIGDVVIELDLPESFLEWCLQKAKGGAAPVGHRGGERVLHIGIRCVHCDAEVRFWFGSLWR